MQLIASSPAGNPGRENNTDTAATKSLELDTQTEIAWKRNLARVPGKLAFFYRYRSMQLARTRKQYGYGDATQSSSRTSWSLFVNVMALPFASASGFRIPHVQ